MSKQRRAVFLAAGSVLVVALIVALNYYQPWAGRMSAVRVTGHLPGLTAEEKMSDFHYLYEVLRDNYPYFELKARQYGYDWRDRKDEFEAWVAASADDRAYYETINRIVTLLQNGHTRLLTLNADQAAAYAGTGPPWKAQLSPAVVEAAEYWRGVVGPAAGGTSPLTFGYVAGKYVVAGGAEPDWEQKYGVAPGDVLVTVDGMRPEEYLLAQVDRKWLRFDLERQVPFSPDFDLAFVPAGGGQSFADLRFRSPGRREHDVRVPRRVSPDVSGTAEAGQEEPAVVTAFPVPGKVAYLRIPSFSSYRIREDKPVIQDFLKRAAAYPALVIDIRGNSGGSTQYWSDNLVLPLLSKGFIYTIHLAVRGGDFAQPFVEYKSKMKGLKTTTGPSTSLPEGPDWPPEVRDGSLKQVITWEIKAEPVNPTGFKGYIYLLVDWRVFSAAESFAAFCKDTGFATIVGTHTGGDGIGFDPLVVALPKSGLVVRFSGDMGLNADGTANEETHTAPDVSVEQSYEDCLKVLAEYAKGTRSPDYREWVDPTVDTVLRRALEIAQEPK